MESSLSVRLPFTLGKTMELKHQAVSMVKEGEYLRGVLTFTLSAVSELAVSAGALDAVSGVQTELITSTIVNGTWIGAWKKNHNKIRIPKSSNIIVYFHTYYVSVLSDMPAVNFVFQKKHLYWEYIGKVFL